MTRVATNRRDGNAASMSGPGCQMHYHAHMGRYGIGTAGSAINPYPRLPVPDRQVRRTAGTQASARQP